MKLEQLVTELHSHGNHLAIVKGTSTDDLARGVGLVLLALERLLREAGGMPAATDADRGTYGKQESGARVGQQKGRSAPS